MSEHQNGRGAPQGLVLDGGQATLLADPPSEALLSALWAAQRPLTVDELSERSALPVSTVRRNLRQLADGGVLRTAPASGRRRYELCPAGLKHLVSAVLPLVAVVSSRAAS